MQKTYKVTYIGDSESVQIRGYQFKKSVPVEYVNSDNQALIGKLKGNRFFEVHEFGVDVPVVEREEEVVSVETYHAEFPTGSKEELAAWAKENLGLEFHHRKGLGGMIAEVEERLAQ